jgi:hypothetical protein
LVQSRWRSWVRNIILVYLNFLSHPTSLPINTTWWY